MKKILIILLAIIFIIPVFTGCEEKEEVTPPDLPPYESMAIDFSDFYIDSKSMSDYNLLYNNKNVQSQVNYGAASLTVFFWNFTLGAVIAVPVASFYASFNNTPEYLGDQKWQWTYDVNVVSATYTARLTGKIRTDDIKWEMYIIRTGVNAHDEFKWYEGTSDLDGNGAQWILYHSYDFQEEVLQIDWTKSGDDIGQIKYTYIREFDDDGNENPRNGTYLTYGLQDDYFNAFYTIHNYIEGESSFKDIYIEWSTTEYYGHIKSEHYYQDTEWHCWDNLGNDIDCTD